MAVLMRMALSLPVCRRLLLAVALAPITVPAVEPLESAVKAAYLTKFGIYVEWPDAAPDSPLNLCVAGEDPFGKALDSAAASQQPGNRPIAVRRLKAAAPDSGCDMLYIGGADPAAPQVIDSLRGSPVLTVSDARDSGAIINFVIQDNRVRFEIDEAAAVQNNLVLSSKLLSLALNVKPRR